jgi:hypothetical protein
MWAFLKPPSDTANCSCLVGGLFVRNDLSFKSLVFIAVAKSQIPNCIFVPFKEGLTKKDFFNKSLFSPYLKAPFSKMHAILKLPFVFEE